MNFHEYRPLALRTAKMFPTQRENLRHAALGLLTEIGEFATEVKRIAIYGKPMTDAMREHMIEEIGDVQWYVPLGLLSIGCDRNSMSDKQSALLRIEMTRLNNFADITVYIGALSAGVMGTLATDSVDDERDMVANCMLGIVTLIDQCVAPLLGIEPDEIRARNIAKLRQRFPEAYSDQAAEARADKNGLDARNS